MKGGKNMFLNLSELTILNSKESDYNCPCTGCRGCAGGSSMSEKNDSVQCENYCEND